MTCSKGERGGIGSPKWPGAIMVPFEKYMAIMPVGGNIHKIWALYTLVLVLLGVGVE